MYDHILDPSGDVIFSLENPDAPFAVWQDGDGDGDGEANGNDNGNEPSIPITRTVTFLVSSRHLILASPVLNAALTGGWNEGVVNEASSLHEIITEEWDAEAMAIVMSIIHHRWPQVPRVVSLELLAKIAVIVDYYQIHETVQIMSEPWIEHARKSLPNSYGREILLWMCISSVFKNNTIFKHVTTVAIRHCPGNMESLRLPIPSAAIDEINRRRREALDTVSASLDGLKNDYLLGIEGCNYACRSMQLGALMMGMDSLELLDRWPGKPWGIGPSLADYVERIQQMKTPVWYGQDPSCTDPSHKKPFSSRKSFNPGSSLTCSSCRQPHNCGKMNTTVGVGFGSNERVDMLSEHTKALAHKIVGKMKGLKLGSYI